MYRRAIASPSVSFTPSLRYLRLCGAGVGHVPAPAGAVLGVAGGPGEDGGAAGGPLPGGDAAGSPHLTGGAGHRLLAQNAAVQQRPGDGHPTARSVCRGRG